MILISSLVVDSKLLTERKVLQGRRTLSSQQPVYRKRNRQTQTRRYSFSQMNFSKIIRLDVMLLILHIRTTLVFLCFLSLRVEDVSNLGGGNARFVDLRLVREQSLDLRITRFQEKDYENRMGQSSRMEQGPRRAESAREGWGTGCEGIRLE